MLADRSSFRCNSVQLGAVRRGGALPRTSWVARWRAERNPARPHRVTHTSKVHSCIVQHKAIDHPRRRGARNKRSGERLIALARSHGAGRDKRTKRGDGPTLPLARLRRQPPRDLSPTCAPAHGGWLVKPMSEVRESFERAQAAAADNVSTVTGFGSIFRGNWAPEKSVFGRSM